MEKNKKSIPLNFRGLLFFNQLAFRYKFLSVGARFLAIYGIYVLIAWLLVVLYLAGVVFNAGFWFAEFGVLIFGFALSYFIAFIWPTSRPKDRFPEVVELISLKKFERFKSFPSDHSLMAFYFAGQLVGFFGLNFFSVAGLVLALFVAISRVMVGVHSPWDIVFGSGLGLLLSRLFFWI